MKFNMICINFDQNIKKPKKPKFWTFGVFRGRLNARVMETAGKAFYGGTECACKGNSV